MRDDKIRANGKRKHYQKYSEMADRLNGWDLMRMVPFTLNEIKTALEQGDEHLNTLPLKKWDAASTSLYSAGGITLSECVCLLKHVALHQIAGFSAEEFIGDTNGNIQG